MLIHCWKWYAQQQFFFNSASLSNCGTLERTIAAYSFCQRALVLYARNGLHAVICRQFLRIMQLCVLTTVRYSVVLIRKACVSLCIGYPCYMVQPCSRTVFTTAQTIDVYSSFQATCFVSCDSVTLERNVAVYFATYMSFRNFVCFSTFYINWGLQDCNAFVATPDTILTLLNDCPLFFHYKNSSFDSWSEMPRFDVFS